MEKEVEKRKNQRWGVMIAALFGGFALFVIILAIVAAQQDFDLVDTDYYRKGLQYQSRIDETSRAQALSEELAAVVNQTGDSVTIMFPPECARDSLNGTLHFYRPSNAGWDRRVPIGIGPNGLQSVPTGQFVSGYWRIKAAWMWRGETYYDEIDVFIPEKS